MASKDKRIDAYIAKSADFAKPILNHFRELVHKACPAVEETMKWSFPHFDYKGMMCSMASFKGHCAITFWKAALFKDSDKLITNAKSEVAMGHLGRITSLKDLPKDAELKKYIKEAMRLNDEGIKTGTKKKTLSAPVEVPEFILKAIKKNKGAQKTFEAFSNSHRKEYVMWITEAKTEETRLKRLATAIEWMEEGKHRNWKYDRK